MNKQKQERKERLMPNGKPKHVRIYDNKGETLDRYTVVFQSKRVSPREMGGGFLVLNMSECPFYPQGVGMHDEFFFPPDEKGYSHLGKKIKFDDLPEDCQKAVLQDYKELWDID